MREYIDIFFAMVLAFEGFTFLTTFAITGDNRRAAYWVVCWSGAYILVS